MSIPKIIHQVWEGRTEPKMPTRLKILARTWQEQNPTWEYHLWNGEEMDKLVETHFPEYMSMYKNFHYNVQRWDIIRYMILYVYGGVYTDLDAECFKPIDGLFNANTFCFGEEPDNNNIYIDMKYHIGNALLASYPREEGWMFVLEKIRCALKEKYKMCIVLNTTGPLMLSRIFPELEDKYNATILPNSFVAPVSKREVYDYIIGCNCVDFECKIKSAICAHYFFGSWENEFAFYGK